MPTRLSDPPALELRDVYEGLRLRTYVQNLWSRRGYMLFVATSELRNRQMTSVLGNLWHLLNPILQITVYYLIFGLFLDDVNRGVENFILFLTVGVFMFTDTQRAMTAGGNSMVNNRGILQAIAFPRALLPITSTITETLATLPSILVIYTTVLVTGDSPRLGWALLPIVILTQAWFNLGLALLAARATTHFRDLQQILPFVFRILLYTSGVIFSVEAFATRTSVAWLFKLNPIYCFISIGRWTVMGGPLRAEWVLSAATWTVTMLVGAFLWFRAAEESYGRD